MMAFLPARDDVIESAARSLVRVTASREGKLITLPIFYASGTAVSVEVIKTGDKFIVSDDGQAFRELELVGADRYFRRNADTIAAELGVSAARRSFYYVTSAEQLAGSMADIGSASAQLVNRVFDRIAQRNEKEIASNLYNRLINIFGENHVKADADIFGASNHKWNVSALVAFGERKIAFETVSNHHSSVYSSATMFHDIGLLDNRPKPIAVVENKLAMGEYISILSQAANVIQIDAPDMVLEKLAA